MKFSVHWGQIWKPFDSWLSTNRENHRIYAGSDLGQIIDLQRLGVDQLSQRPDLSRR